jgi:hypothetical protein
LAVAVVMPLRESVGLMTRVHVAPVEFVVPETMTYPLGRTSQWQSRASVA